MRVDTNDNSFRNVDNFLVKGGAHHFHIPGEEAAGLAHQPAEQGAEVARQRVERSPGVPFPEQVLGSGVEVCHVAVQVGFDDRIGVVLGKRRETVGKLFRV